MIPTPHRVKIHKQGERDEWGLYTHSPPEEHPAFVQYSSDRIITNEGNELKVELNITIKGNININYNDKIEFKEISKTPSSIEKIFDLSGEVLFTKVLI